MEKKLETTYITLKHDKKKRQNAILSKTLGRGLSAPPPPLPLYHRGGMNLRERPRQFSISVVTPSACDLL